MPKYAQLNETGLCFGISYLSDEVVNDLLIALQESDDVELGDIWDGEGWTRPEPVPKPFVPSMTERLDTLTAENDQLKDRIALLESALDEVLLGGVI